MKITARLKSEIKRINQRYKDIVQSLGAKSQLAKTYKKYIDKVSTSGMTKSGFLSIKSPSKLNENDIKLINVLSRLQTKGEYNTSKETLYQKLFNKKPTKKELKDFITTIEDIHSFIEEHATFIYNVSDTMRDALHRSGNLSSDEFMEMQKLIKIANDTHFDVIETIKRLNQESVEQYD